MAQPQPYSPSHDFIPDTNIGHVPGQQLDVEFNNLQTTTDQIRANLALIQNDDTTLKNGVVGTPQLNSSLQTAFNSLQAALALATGPAGPTGPSGVSTGNFVNTTGVVWQHSPAVSPGADDNVFGLNYSPTTFTNNGTYKDAVWILGTNQGPGGRIDTNKPSTFLQWENKFWGGASFNQELHVITNTIEGTVYRPVQFILPQHTADAAVSSLSISINDIEFAKYGGGASSFSMSMGPVPSGSAFNILSGAKILANTNNVPVALQINLAGDTYLNLPYVNSSNQLSVSQPTIINASGVGAGNNTVQVNSTGHGDASVMIDVEGAGTAVTGSVSALFANVSASVDAKIRLRNSASSGRSAAIVEANAGDVVVQFAPTIDGTLYTMGVDHSDSDKFKLSGSTALGTTDLVTATTAGAVGVVGPVTAQNATAIPAGGAAGAGLMLSSTANFGIFFGSGAPTLAAAKGSLYLRSDGTTTNDRMYVNTNGNTTWTNVTTAG